MIWKVHRRLTWLTRVVLLLVVLYGLHACNEKIYKGNIKKTSAAREALTPTDTFIRNQLKGIDFIAQGNEPAAWKLSLDFERNFIFKPSDSRTLITSAAVADTQTGKIMYATQTDDGPMKIIVYSEQCNSMANEPASVRTEVYLNNKLYRGCGKYLYDFLLNDIWELQQKDDKEIPKADYKKQLPRIEFDLVQHKMMGYDGCNNIQASITINGNHINFSSINGVGNNCATSTIFAGKISNRTIDYTIKDDLLTLYLIDDSKLIFKKVQ